VNLCKTRNRVSRIDNQLGPESKGMGWTNRNNVTKLFMLVLIMTLTSATAIATETTVYDESFAKKLPLAKSFYGWVPAGPSSKLSISGSHALDFFAIDGSTTNGNLEHWSKSIGAPAADTKLIIASADVYVSGAGTRNSGFGFTDGAHLKYDDLNDGWSLVTPTGSILMGTTATQGAGAAVRIELILDLVNNTLTGIVNDAGGALSKTLGVTDASALAGAVHFFVDTRPTDPFSSFGMDLDDILVIESDVVPEPATISKPPKPATVAERPELVLPTQAELSELPIVRNGRPLAVILVGDNAAPVSYESAEELARTIEKATGARLSIVPEGEFINPPSHADFPTGLATKILIGDGNHVRALGIDISKLPTEGFIIKTIGRYLVIAGRDDPHEGVGARGNRRPARLRGTWYGTIGFLEDYLGARWLWPGPLGEIIPQKTDLVVANVDHSEAPALVIRTLRSSFHYSNWTSWANDLGFPIEERIAMGQELSHWIDHQRLGNSISIYRTEFGKTWVHKFGKEHQDWFALQPDGKRLLKLLRPHQRPQMCFSNPGLIDEVVRRAVEYVDAHPLQDGYGIYPSDSIEGYECVCDLCKANGPSLSDQRSHYFQAVAEKLAELRPGKYGTALAYYNYVDPPTSDIQLGDNVLLDFCNAGYFEDEERRKSIARWEGWAKHAQKMVWRPNNFCNVIGAGVPRSYVTKMGRDFSHFYQHKMVGIDFDRIHPQWACAGLNYYVAAKLAWNPLKPVEDIVNDYCEKGFGTAAPAVKKYFAALEKVTDRVAAERNKGEEISSVYTTADLKELREVLYGAKVLAGDDRAVLARIAFLAEALDFADVEVPVYRAIAQTHQSKPSQAQKDSFRKLLDHRKAYIRQHLSSRAVDVVSHSWREEWLEDQLLRP
jgi:hypothetical protein